MTINMFSSEKKHTGFPNPSERVFLPMGPALPSQAAKAPLKLRCSENQWREGLHSPYNSVFF